MVAAGQRAQLAPGHGHRDAQTRAGPHAPCTGGGGAKAVAQVIDEDLAHPVARPALGHKPLGQRLRHVQHHGVGEALDGVPVFMAAQGHHHVQALAAAGFQKTRETQFGQRHLHQLGGLLYLGPGYAGAWVQVKGHAVGPANGVGRGVPGVEFQHVHLRGRHQRVGRGDLQQRLVARVQGRVQLAHAGQFGGLGVLLKELRAFDA